MHALSVARENIVCIRSQVTVIRHGWYDGGMTYEIHELDVVALTADLPDHGLCRGQVGTVVLEHLPPDSVDVEFVDEEGKTYAVVTLLKRQLLRLHYRRVETA